jgi:hypothetical protein
LNGEASRAIRAAQSCVAIRGPKIFAAWDYNVARAAEHALACRADGLLMPGIDSNEMFALLLGILGRTLDGAPPPASASEHEAILRTHTSQKSPFWQNQGRVASPHF